MEEDESGYRAFNNILWPHFAAPFLVRDYLLFEGLHQVGREKSAPRRKKYDRA
jgi:hypothetical protein